MTDSAPFIVAQEMGFFARFGIAADLCREVGWATIREKIIYGELEAAQAPAPMLWSTRLGQDSVACPVLTALILNQNGNALTLSEKLWEAGVRDPKSLRDEARRRSGERKLTFGVVFSHSSHHVMLRTWLRAAGLNPERDVRIVVVPPAQMVRNLAAGTIDGFCAGEPYGSVAVDQKIGWIAASSATLQPGAPEKVLMVTERFAFEQTEEHYGLVLALAEACRWCDEAANRPTLARLLSLSRHVNQPEDVILRALHGSLTLGHGEQSTQPDFLVFHRKDANRPAHTRAVALQRELQDAKLLPAELERELPRRLFREDIFLQAHAHLKPTSLLTS